MIETKIYILIPVYNAEEYLDECLNSILSQNYSEYEVILVNDGSKDSSGEICDRYTAKYKHVHTVHKENGGQISARLAAVHFVRENLDYKNSYCIFLDADDLLKTGALPTISKKISDSNCEMLIYGYEKFDSNGVFYTTFVEESKEIIIDDLGELLREAVIEHSYNSLCRKAVKTELLFFDLEERYKQLRIGEDLMHSLGIYRQNPRTLIIPDLLYSYRMNSESITHTFNLKRFTDELSSRSYTLELIKDLHVWTEEDFEKYLNMSISVLRWIIRQILSGSGSYKNTIQNLKQSYEHPFVQKYCMEKSSRRSDVWLYAFSKKRFRTLFLLHKLSHLKNSI